MRSSAGRSGAPGRGAADRSLAVATVAMTPDLEPEVNRRRLAEIVRRIASEHPDVELILFGETILGWFYRGDGTADYHRRIAETIPGRSTEFVARLAKEHGVFVSFGLSERRDGSLYNSQVLIGPDGEIAAVHRKFWIRNPVFAAGPRALTTVDVRGAKVAILICADARSVWLLRAIRRARVDVVLASLADDETGAWLNRFLAIVCDAWTIVANRFGQEPPRTWHGLITICDPLGRLCSHGIGKQQFVYRRIPIARRGSTGRTLRRLCAGARLPGLLAAIAWTSIGKALRKG